MRFSTTAVFAAVAIGAQALPQEAQPITQISDGQIQAPPATAPAASSAPSAPAVSASGSYEVPSAPAATEVLPSVSPVPLPSVVPSSAPAVVPAPSAPAGTGSAPPYPISSGAIYTNGTVAPTGGASSSAPAGETSAGSGGSPQPTSGPGNSGAATTFVSMGALFAGLFAFLA